jgi:PDZ domain-containing protein
VSKIELPPPLEPETTGPAEVSAEPVEPETAGPGPAAPAAPPAVPSWLVVAALLVVFFGVAGSVAHVPYYSVGPGPARDVLRLIKGRNVTTYPSRGKLLLTTASVSASPLTVWEYALTLVEPNVVAIPRSRLLEPGRTNEEQDAENFRAMEESKQRAEIAAFHALGLPVARVPGARILTVLGGAPAEGKLRPGDLIVAIDGKRVTTPEQAAQGIRAHHIGDSVRFTVTRAGRRADVVARTRASLDDPKRAAVGVTLANAYRLPRDIEIDTQQIGGPSGGLVFALSIVDAFTPDDLTHGHVIAVTGEIKVDEAGRGVVSEIGAIEEKVHSALAAGADTFIVPASQAAAAKAEAPPKLNVIGVRTLDEALSVLRNLPPKA